MITKSYKELLTFVFEFVELKMLFSFELDVKDRVPGSNSWTMSLSVHFDHFNLKAGF